MRLGLLVVPGKCLTFGLMRLQLASSESTSCARRGSLQGNSFPSLSQGRAQGRGRGGGSGESGGSGGRGGGWLQVGQ